MSLNELSDAVRRYYDLPPGFQLAGVNGVHLVHNVESLLGERVGKTYSMRTSVAAVAGEYQIISLLQPATALGVVVEIIGVHVQNVAGGQIYFGVGTSTTYTDRGAGYALDLRDFTSGYRSAARFLDESNAAISLVAQGELIGFSERGGIQPLSVFLRPGYLFSFATGAVNQGLRGMIVWRETAKVQNP